MTSRLRRISLTIAATLASGAMVAAPAHAANDGTYTYYPTDGGVIIGNWVGGSANCPATLTIPAALGGSPVVAIEFGAFSGSACLSATGATKSIDVPASVTTIGSQAFALNPGLTQITIRGDVATLPAKVFNGDTALTTVIFLGGGPSYVSDTFAGVPDSAQVFYKRGTTLHSGAAWPGTYANRSTYVLPEFGVAGLRAGQVSRKSSRVFFFPTVGTNANGIAYLMVYAKVKKNGRTYTKLMCSGMVAMAADSAANMQCSSTAARKLVKKHKTKFYARLTFVQSGSGFITAPVTKTVTIKRKR